MYREFTNTRNTVYLAKCIGHLKMCKSRIFSRSEPNKHTNLLYQCRKNWRKSIFKCPVRFVKWTVCPALVDSLYTFTFEHGYGLNYLEFAYFEKTVFFVFCSFFLYRCKKYNVFLILITNEFNKMISKPTSKNLILKFIVAQMKLLYGLFGGWTAFF